MTYERKGFEQKSYVDPISPLSPWERGKGRGNVSLKPTPTLPQRGRERLREGKFVNEYLEVASGTGFTFMRDHRRGGARLSGQEPFGMGRLCRHAGRQRPGSKNQLAGAASVLH